MSWHDYQQSKEIASADPSFNAIIMAAFRKADSTNKELLFAAFPHLYVELQQRYNAPGGYLGNEVPSELNGYRQAVDQ